LPNEAGSSVPLKDAGETIGRVVRTQTGRKPVYVSPGHLVSFEAAEGIVMKTVSRYRLPEPVRLAHQEVNRFRKKFTDAGSISDYV